MSGPVFRRRQNKTNCHSAIGNIDNNHLEYLTPSMSKHFFEDMKLLFVERTVFKNLVN